MSRRKFFFALCIIFGLAASTHQTSACEKTDDIITDMNNQEQTAVIEHYRTLLAQITQLLHEFVHHLHDNKPLNHYLKELTKLTKELGEMAKRNHEADSTRHGTLHKRLYAQHKKFHEFIAIIKANESSPQKIGLELMKRAELKNLIPDQAGWSLTNVLPALNTRCKK